MLGGKPKLVLDTNTLVSAFFWEGNEAELLRYTEQSKAVLYVTHPVLDEVRDVISRPKFFEAMKRTQYTPDQVIQKIMSLSRLVVPKQTITICRDPKDNKFLECAQTAKADYLVTGDSDLLVLKKYQETMIMTTSIVLSLLE